MKTEEALAKYSAISLSEMDHVKLMDRVDTKFAFSFAELPRFLEILASDYKCLEINGVRYAKYSSVYFDSEHFQFYHDHHRQKMSRFKIRMRKYVDSELTFLEIKHKFKGRTVKKRIKIGGLTNNLNDLHKDFIRNTKVGDYNLSACLENSFNRITLVGLHLNERLTLDFGINFKWGNESKDLENLVIAELKQERADRNSPFFELMRKEAKRPYRLSKYCMGTMEIHRDKDLKTNRFKQKLNTINKIAAHV